MCFEVCYIPPSSKISPKFRTGFTDYYEAPSEGPVLEELVNEPLYEDYSAMPLGNSVVSMTHQSLVILIYIWSRLRLNRQR